MIVLDCTDPSFEFLWVDKRHYLRPTRLPAREYIDTLFDWLKEQLEDETLFPVEECDFVLSI